MTRRALALLGTALALGTSAPALAQSSMGGMDPATMTCSDLSALEQDRQEGAVYFVAGYQFGGMSGISGATGTSATTGATSTDTSGSTSTDTTTGTENTAGATDSTTGSGSTDTTGSTDAGTMMTASAGFDQISVDQILSACGESPERMVSDVLREQSGAASQ